MFGPATDTKILIEEFRRQFNGSTRFDLTKLSQLTSTALKRTIATITPTMALSHEKSGMAKIDKSLAASLT